MELVNWRVVHVLCFLIDFQSTCSVHYWKWDIAVSDYYFRMVHFSFQFCQFLIHIFWWSFVNCICIKLLYLLSGLAVLAIYNILWFSLTDLGFILSDISVSIPVTLGYYFHELSFFICSLSTYFWFCIKSLIYTMNFQMFKLVLEKADEPEIKLPTSAGSLKKNKRVPEKHLFVLYWLCQSLWLCGLQ